VTDSTPTYTHQPGGSGLKIPILFGVVIALVAANVYLFLQVDRLHADIAKMRESILTEITNLRESSTVTTQANRRNVETLRDELEAARRQASMAAGQAKTEATKRAEDLARRLELEAKRQQEQVSSAITEVKQANEETAQKVGAVSTEVGAVKTEVAAAKSELNQTLSNLKRVFGELDSHASLIATNSKELDALRALGDRNYFEFRIRKAKQPQKVGDIAVKVKKTDTKRNKYTIELLADDKTVEKKDRTINEPVQFYVAKARQPYELVVNQVNKDEIVGYLATPKVQSARK